jgi:hypothetical protein
VHPFADEYERLLGSLVDLRKWPDAGLCATTALTGEKWAGDVAFYGRAANGWVEQASFKANDISTPEARRSKVNAVCEVGNEKGICDLDVRSGKLVEDTKCDGSKLHWVHHQRNKEKDPDGYNSKAATPFWRTIELVIRDLHPEAQEDNWASWVAWSNLYKVAPVAGGNPGASVTNLQFDPCFDLLNAELGMWRPKAAVFLTETNKRDTDFDQVDYGGWFGEFLKRMDVSRKLQPLIVNGEKPLVHTGEIHVGGHLIRVALALRPETIGSRLADHLSAALVT